MSIELPLFSINGVIGAAISPMDRGFAYGDGLFETCRYQSGQIPLWDFHRDRLLTSAKRLKIAVDEAQLCRYLTDVVAALGNAAVDSAVVKIQLTRGVGGRGYRAAANLEPTYCLGAFPVEPLGSCNYYDGVDVRVCYQRLAANPALAGMKHLNRLEQILARAEWQDEYAEGLLLDGTGSVIEATVSNLFVVKNGELFTADLSQCGVAGVMRGKIIEHLAPALSMDVKITHMDLDFVFAADELFLCNSVYGIWPVNRLVDDRNADIREVRFVAPAVSRRLQKSLEYLFA